jgi:hypothetical protein
MVCPILLGSGQLLLRDTSRRSRLDLLEEKRFSSGIVMLRYVGL